MRDSSGRRLLQGTQQQAAGADSPTPRSFAERGHAQNTIHTPPKNTTLILHFIKKINCQLLIVNCLCCFWLQTALAQYSTVIKQESQLILPPDYSPIEKYPIVVLMPYTNGSATDYWSNYLSEAHIQRDEISRHEQLRQFLELYNAQFGSNNKGFAVIIPDGTGSRNDHSWAGFAACIERYEKRVLRDVRKFSKIYTGLDTNQVYITGVSLGGDLSWALTVRNPTFFKGALVTGSRCSFPPTALPTMAANGFKYFMVMGMNEGQDRLVGMRYARQLLDSAYVQYVYREMPFLEHNRAPLWLFLDGLHWLLESNTTPITPDLQPDLSDWQDGDYEMDIEICHWELAKEDDLAARGDALLSCTRTERLVNQSVSLTLKGNYLWIQVPGQSPIKARFLPQENGGDAVYIEVLEQELGKNKYQGRVTEWDNPKHHGFWDKNADMIVLDFERFPLTNHNQRTSFSLMKSSE